MGISQPEIIHAIAISLAFFLISYLHIVLGELAPKSLAIRQAERIGLLTAAPLFAFYWLMFPAIWILNHSAGWILTRLGLNEVSGHDSPYSPEELKLILKSARAGSGYSRDEWSALAQSLDFHKLTVADLMRPFNEAVVLQAADSLEQNLERIARHRFSRYPWLDKHGLPTGLVHVKDVFLALHKSSQAPDLASLTRPIIRVKPGDAAASLFRRFRSGTPHMAIVMAGAGQRPVGFITLDNLLGALVGEIRDEFRSPDNAWTRMDDGTLIGKGSLPIFTLQQALGREIDDGGAESISGLILNRLCDLPQEGQRIPFEGFDAVVKKMRGPRILLVRIYPKTPEQETPDAHSSE